MKKVIILILAITLAGFQKHSPSNPNLHTKKEITLEEIWGGAFYTKRMNALNSMNGDYYSLLNYNKETKSSTIDKYSYKTLEKVETVLDGKNLPNLSYFSSYDFNNDETQILLGTQFKQVYRRSYKGTYYAYNRKTKSLTLIGKEIQEPTFSPDSKKVAYAKNNNLYIKDLTTNKVIQVTNDGKYNHIINGTTDWVYEEEFGFVKAFEWSTDSKNLAFLRFDETNVREFSMSVTGRELYPSSHDFKYPKAGEDNAIVSLHMYNLSSATSKKIDLGNYEYIPRIKWSNDKNVLIATTLNRHQNNLNLVKVNATDYSTSVLLNETDKAYVDVNDNLTFLDDNSFIWTSEKDGYNHIYHYDFNGKLINQITKGNWEVTKYYGYNKKKKTIYYQSVEIGSINRGVYSIKLNGKSKKLLSNNNGTNSAAFSKNLNYFINTYSSADTPPVYSLYSANGKMLKEVKTNNDLKEKLAGYNISKKEFSTISINGEELNMWTIKPTNFDASKKYPLLMFQYSGPGSQEVANRWKLSNDYWHQMLAQQGMIVVCIDSRGTGFKGRDFKKMTYKELGRYEVEDNITAAKKLAQLPYINPEKIGIWGWSYGGFMSSNCLLKGNDIFSTAIAVAPVTSWRFYDTVYTERFMQTPQENANGYDDNSPINHAKKLKGNFLIVHGTGDDNVHIQNTYRMINALVEANKQFDSAIYPDRAHGIYKGKNTRLQLYTKMTQYLQQHLLN